MTKLLIVEDNAILANTLRRFLQLRGNLTIVATVSTAEDALNLLPSIDVDLVLVDLALPTISGIELIAILHNLFPHLPCLVLSGHHEREYVKRALAAGARGYAIKSEPVAIFTGINNVLAGEIYVSEALSDRLYTGLTHH